METHRITATGQAVQSVALSVENDA